jgi:histone deacetylase complex regulatory component SIN3
MPPMAQMGGGQQTPLGHAVNAARPNPTHISEMQSMQGNRDGWGNFPSSGGGDMAQRQVQNQGMQGHEPAQMQSGHQAPMLQPQKPPMTDQQQQEQQENPAIEFDHAITYVTTIKKRFGNEPRTYQQFLEILHTYQKEQRGIREVLEQVSSLFADHPDLLKQFTYFLPEAVQEQAKERLHAAAAEAEARQAAARKRAAEASNHYAAQNKTEPRGEGQEISFDLTQKVCEFVIFLLRYFFNCSFYSSMFPE